MGGRDYRGGLVKRAAAVLGLIVVAGSALAQGGSPARPAISVSLSPPFVEKLVRPGGRVSDTISLTNDSAFPVMVTIDFADFRVNEKGEVEEMPLGTDPSSLSSYVRITPAKLRVNPQGRVFFRYSVETPAVFRQLRTQIFFSSRPVVPNAPNQVVFVPRMGIPLYVENISARGAEIKVDEIRWSRSPDKGALLLGMLVSNTGERNIRPKGFVEVRSADGKFSKTFPFNQGNEPLLPGQKRNWPLSFGPVPGGELSVRLRFATSSRTSFDQQYHVPAS
jgi:P pilus assembly chaperone PapD